MARAARAEHAESPGRDLSICESAGPAAPLDYNFVISYADRHLAPASSSAALVHLPCQLPAVVVRPERIPAKTLATPTGLTMFGGAVRHKDKPDIQASYSVISLLRAMRMISARSVALSGE
jgi:hypothetical protein